jgi:two-component system, sensor histidine kinase and response regulator
MPITPSLDCPTEPRISPRETAEYDMAPPNPDRLPRLLIVDDEEGPRESLRMVFKNDYQVQVASSARDALQILQTQRIDVAVLDIRMPEITGLDLLERVRQLDATIEVVMLTAFETPDYLRKALRLRACDYLNKPFDVANIRQVVSSAVVRRSNNKEVQENIQQLAEIREQVQQLRVKEETMRTRWEIYASIIHDINSPLTIISGLVQLVNQRINQDSPLVSEDLEQIKDRMRRVTRQVTNCIEISRRYLKLLSPNGQEPGKVWVNSILLDLGDLVRALPDARGHELQIRPLSKDVMLLVNGTDLIQMLLNLTINALQCSKECHLVEVRGELHPKPIDVSELKDDQNQRLINMEHFQNTSPTLALSIMDNGPGILPNILERIFEPFVSQQAGERRAGLGLCIVKRLLKENKSGLHVHSEVGRGSMFTLYLPARLPSGQQPP